jgi:periplasmic mercuric ion binding protein
MSSKVCAPRGSLKLEQALPFRSFTEKANTMKSSILALIATAALATIARAESTVKLSDVHLCCKSCVTGVEKAIAKAKGVTATVDKDAGTVTLTGADKATVQGGVDALVAAGYYGKSDSADVVLKDMTGAKDGKVASLMVNDVHLCCGKCVTAVQDALEKVKGVTGNTAEKNAKTFEVKGDFSPKEVFAAIHAAGLTGKAGK